MFLTARKDASEVVSCARRRSRRACTLPRVQVRPPIRIETPRGMDETQRGAALATSYDRHGAGSNDVQGAGLPPAELDDRPW
jgi:hypothetical protein